MTATERVQAREGEVISRPLPGEADRIAMSCWGVHFVLERRHLPSAQEIVLVTSDGSSWHLPPPPGYELLIAAAAQAPGALPAAEVNDATTVSLSASVVDDIEEVTITEGEAP